MALLKQYLGNARFHGYRARIWVGHVDKRSDPLRGHECEFIRDWLVQKSSSWFPSVRLPNGRRRSADPLIQSNARNSRGRMRRLRACVPVRPHVEVEDRAVLAMTYAATLPHYYFKSRCFFFGLFWIWFFNQTASLDTLVLVVYLLDLKESIYLVLTPC